ncbi:unannotated protein [freshwater metagenome]|uniref:Unannotated protein n=1 Tax=freshwater metagenome TaxID=449393 RepID=A0A6J7PTR1_9ZZZZ|nr:DUF3159 domain-containing protein [Actinomycetota bacterium]
MSYDGHDEDRDKVIGALGGKRGLIDTGVPSLVFLVIFNFSHNLNRSVIAALIVSAIFTIARLIRRETLQHALSGLVGIGICALFSRHSGEAKDFYLPGLLTNLGYGLLYLITNLFGWPLLGVMLGPILGEDFRWRKDPRRKAAYIRAGWLWVGMFAARLLVQYPLYRANQINWLGTARLAMGYPLFFATAWASWLIIRKVPSTKK